MRFPIPWLDRAALVSVMLLPVLLLHAHGIAEGAIAVADVCLLAASALRHDWRWLRTPWFRIAGAWWLWLVVCSLPLPVIGVGEGRAHSLVQAIVMVRFLMLAACLEHLALRADKARRWMFGLVAASAVWVGGNALIQQVFGHNLLGWPRSGDGELTGPFRKPRAGPALARILIPAILPPVSALLGRHRAAAAVGAYALLLLGVVVMVLIGQRMPLVISVFGLVVAAVLMPRLRPLVLAGAVAGGLLLAASPVVAPSAYYRLVEKFSGQIEHFAVSHYGKLYARAWEIGVQNPVTGLGFDGFATGCKEPRYFRPSFDGSIADGGGAVICWDHPHNYYFQALADGGFVGLVLFSATAVAWLTALGRGLGRDPEPVRVALFAAAFLQLWPIQSSTAFYGMPIGGWFFLLLGWGLAEARWRPLREARGRRTDQSQGQPSVGPVA
ncbi:MAG TPA: O-antigen ligase family protein [Rhodopila sp.]|nr:O-antigen ligase family protein [Rhodopila sp.]